MDPVNRQYMHNQKNGFALKLSAINNHTKTILGSKIIFLVVPVLAFLISLPFLSMGWMFDDVYLQIQMRDTLETKEYVPEMFSFNPVKGYYVLLEKDPEKTVFLKDLGAYLLVGK